MPHVTRPWGLTLAGLSPAFTLFRSSLPDRFHTETVEHLREARYEDGAPHEAVPDFVLNDPAVWAQVEKLVGAAQPDPCRHVHVNTSSKAQPWHVDDYCGQPWPEGGEYAILGYFPQDTIPDMGPTEVRVGGRTIAAAGPAGTCLLMRHTTEHRAGANTSGRERFMVKYLLRATP